MCCTLTEKEICWDGGSRKMVSSRHDPRAPLATRNLSIDETCEYYGVQDWATSCRYPRSCRDCLDKPGCVLTRHGFCRSIANDNVLSGGDFHLYLSPGVTSYSGGQLTYRFYANNATYCAAADAVCSACRADFHQLARSSKTLPTVDTQFCVGANGCVCLGACDVASYWSSMVYDPDCGIVPPPFDTKQDRAARLSNASPRDPRAPPGMALRPATEDTCEYFSDHLDAQGCRRPRSCLECLTKPECMVDDYRCVSMAQYNRFQDFRWVNQLANQSHGIHFPSVNTTYCPASDAVCMECRARFQARRQEIRYDDDFCVGANGCVCIETCESDLLLITDPTCGNTLEDGANETVILLFVLGIFVLLVLIFDIHGDFALQYPPANDPDPPRVSVTLRHMVDQVPALSRRLDLFGWRQVQERLLQKETELLQGVDHVSPVHLPVDFDYAYPTAPELEEDESSAPTTTNPRALASAPRYRVSTGDQHAIDEDLLLPSAPDFGDDEWDDEWDATQSIEEHADSVVLHQRSRRSQSGATPGQ